MTFAGAAELADQAAGDAALAKAQLSEDRPHQLLAEAVEHLAAAVAELSRGLDQRD
ncbi:hypothetical protein [Williamsia sterculiae]|uniref:Uncharacterized protein n=1 Tax=Williamsia sterculiae TaxID=1344003 RepID=A0A1N7EGB7_9NOCA|nr:hypothetical protein [Williamsia sterculiae]SIR86955.1 hypothetical protein SAMN05445060_1268 [Williamsia sterculiae]